MRLADYLVSYSLQINNRCLRYLAECNTRDGQSGAAIESEDWGQETQSVYAENLLARDSRRLCSLWQLWPPGRASDELEEHIKALADAAHALSGGSAAHRLALRLASLADADEEAAALLTVARTLPRGLSGDAALSWSDLNEMFADDSLHWRGALQNVEIDDQVLIGSVARNYRKGYRRAGKVPADRQTEPADGDFTRSLKKLNRWVQLTSHQLELFRGGLSEKGKAQIWYLNKLADALRMRDELFQLQQTARSASVDAETSDLVVAYVDGQIVKMNKRIVRLLEGSFSAKPNKLSSWLTGAVQAMGLAEVSRLPSEKNQQTDQGTSDGSDHIENA